MARHSANARVLDVFTLRKNVFICWFGEPLNSPNVEIYIKVLFTLGFQSVQIDPYGPMEFLDPFFCQGLLEEYEDAIAVYGAPHFPSWLKSCYVVLF